METWTRGSTAEERCVRTGIETTPFHDMKLAGEFELVIATGLNRVSEYIDVICRKPPKR